MTARYDAGERDTTFLTDYLDVLGSAYDAQKTVMIKTSWSTPFRWRG